MFRGDEPRQPCGERIAAAVIWLLSFVRRGGICCGAVTHSLPLPIVGRFLPRLGSLAMLVTLFLESRLVAPSPTPPPHEREGRGGGNRDVDQSSLFRSGPIGMQFLQGDLVEPVGDRLKVLRDSRK